jgi:hypothetical protein
MTTATFLRSDISFRVGDVVSPAPDLGGIQSVTGALLDPGKLGPGLVEQFLPEGCILVRWLDSGVTSCMQPEELKLLGQSARLVVVKKCDERGQCTLSRYKLASRLGFTHNWTVEMRPRNIIRVLRDDGSAWTFSRNPIFNNVSVHWLQPPQDEDAEALTAAETAFSR